MRARETEPSHRKRGFPKVQSLTVKIDTVVLTRTFYGQWQQCRKEDHNRRKSSDALVGIYLQDGIRLQGVFGAFISMTNRKTELLSVRN